MCGNNLRIAWSSPHLLLTIYAMVSVPLTAGGASSTLVPIAVRGHVEASGIEFHDILTIPTINDSGEIAFRANAQVAGQYSSSSPWVAYPSGEFNYLAHFGMPAPGAEPLYFEGFAYLSSNAAGQSAFYGLLPADDKYDPFAQNSGLWASNSEGELRLVARWGQQAPGTTQTFTQPFNYPTNLAFRFAVSKLGQIVFVADTVDPQGTAPGHGVWGENASHELQLLAFANMPVSGSTDGSVFRHISSEWLEASDQGQVSFLAQSSGPGDEVEWEQGLWRQRDNGTLSRAIAEADPLPALNSIRYLHSIHQFSMNNRGDAAILGASRQAPERHLVELRNGYWLTNSTGEATLIALDNAPVPDIDGAQFALPRITAVDAFGVRAKGIILNGKGDVAFMSRFYGPGITENDDTALWIRCANGALQMIAREGEVTPSGSLFGSFMPGDTTMALNGLGQIVFVQDTGRALYASDQKGDVHVIAEAGDQVDIDSGPATDFRTIESIGFLGGSGGEDGWRSGFNDRGQIAFRVNFSWQDAGIFLSNAIAVPEPASAVIGLVCVFAFAVRRNSLSR